MTWSLDARIPIRLVEDRAGLAALLASGRPSALLVMGPDPITAEPGAVIQCHAATASIHPAGCACCTARSAAAIALDSLFQARARSQAPWFERVVILAESCAEREQVRAAMVSDRLVAARFKPA